MYEKLIGARIKELRKRKNLTQDQLGEKINMSSKHLGAIEQGRTFTGIANLVLMAKELDVDLQDFFAFTCLKTRAELIKETSDLMKKADDRDLQIIHKVVKDVMT